ncbi:CDP-glycerol glycerophosphotransferase family protein [Amedibacillus sp. YH-ame10]
MKVRKLFEKLKKNVYFSCKEKAIREQHILLEAGQGKNLNGNMFAMVRELCENESFHDYKVVFVVTEDTKEAAQKRFAFYGYHVELVIRNSDVYKDYLATCKYLLTDNSFPPYFHKRDEQIYLNTWHGTPLKTLGKSDLKNAASLANIQKNYLMSDYALFPNEFTENVFMKDYMLENIYKGKVVLADYPRNRVFLDEQANQNLRAKLGLEDKKLIAYMPTWRGSGREADTRIQKELMEHYFSAIDAQLKDDQIFYVNLHFLLGDILDYSQYQHIKPFPSDYETYDFLAICDMLVTDYSSVFFDFAVSKKKIILFTYDLEDYMRDRGTYFAVSDLPFPIVETVDKLIKEINKKTKHKAYDELLQMYGAYADVHTPEKILNLLVHGKTKGLQIHKGLDNKRASILVYGGKLKNPQLNILLREYLVQLQKENPKKNLILAFRGKITAKKVEFLNDLPEGINYYAIVTKFEFPLKEKIKYAIAMRNFYFAKKFASHSKDFFEEERQRLFYHLTPEKVVYYSGNPHYMYKIMSMFSCEKEAHIHHNNVMGIAARATSNLIMCKYMNAHYTKVIDHRFDDVHHLWEDKENYYNKCLKMGNIFYYISNTKKGLHISGIALAYTVLPFSLKNLKIQVAQQVYDAHLKEGLHIGRGVRLTHYSLTIPYEDVKTLEIQNKVNLVFTDTEGYGICTGIKFDLFSLRKGKNRRGPIHVFPATSTSAYYRQTVNNVLYLTVRKQNATDATKEQCKLNLAYYLAKIVPFPKRILLFEKEGSRYEESASVLYEELIDNGYTNTYFILDKNYPHIDRIDPKYKKNLLYKTSFKHYFYFFKSKTFLGSEAMVHAIDLRISNRCAQKKLARKDNDYVFLQHGVMYMVSLDSESRRFFKPKRTKGKYRVVVSSKEEARHFTELGNYRPEYIYISGLPKYDRNILQEDADKITIMPTWRPWEYNEARYDFSTTKYYQMIERIFHAIPKKDRERVVILPHPLFWDAVKDADFELRPYLNTESKYDDVLKETKVLITDYSSIAYDAFYRGSNVIFYWEEKEECMEAYGPTTKLMLNEENVFGDICYDAGNLKRILAKNLQDSQVLEYVERYQHLVTYHDGHNTQRLIEFMKKDGII